MLFLILFFFFFSSRRRHTRFDCDWSSDVCSSDLPKPTQQTLRLERGDASDLGGPGARRVHRIETVHVEGNIGRAIPYHSACFRDHSGDAHLGELLDEHQAHPMGLGEFDAVKKVLSAAYSYLDSPLRIEHSGLD